MRNNRIQKWLSTPFYLIVWKNVPYLQHPIQVRHSVKHCAKLHTKEAWRIRMQKLCNLLTNFALCFDRAHKEKRCPFKTDSITLFREGGGGDREQTRPCPVLQSVSHQACTVRGEGHSDWDRLTPHSQPTEQLLCTLLWRFFFSFTQNCITRLFGFQLAPHAPQSQDC